MYTPTYITCMYVCTYVKHPDGITDHAIVQTKQFGEETLKDMDCIQKIIYFYCYLVILQCIMGPWCSG